MEEIIILIIYGVLCYSISNIIVYFDGPFGIFSHFRNFIHKHTPPMIQKLFSCIVCFSMWVGMILSVLNLFVFTDFYITPFNYIFDCDTNSIKYVIGAIIFDGFLASGITYLLTTIQEYFEYNTNQ